MECCGLCSLVQDPDDVHDGMTSIFHEHATFKLHYFILYPCPIMIVYPIALFTEQYREWDQHSG